MALVPFQRSNSSSSSHHRHQWRFDVFLSFIGEDTRDNFLSFLYKELNRKGINTFIRDPELDGQREISPEILKAIDESMFSIVVISKNYGSSSWCLDELVKILECRKKERKQIVYPLFYRVDPSEVRKQSGTFGERFDQLVSEYEIEKVRSWREALTNVANLAGYAYPSAAIRSETRLIEEIVKKIFYYLNHVHSSVDEGLVGIDSRVEKLIKLLGLENDDTRVVGIWGMPGIGKTTIARAFYDAISWQFDGCCFVDEVRVISKQCGITSLEEQVISQILIDKDWKASDINIGKSMIKRIISHKKVLIVLDDVDESTDLENLLGERDWFRSGSIIIVITRDLHVLESCGAIQDIYKVRELKEDEAVKLFKSKAFSKNKQIGGYGNLLDRVVENCKGVPLALKVLGSFLHGREESHWESALRRLEETSLPKVEEVLKISYDALDWEEQEIFLDIAFFFKWKRVKDVTKVLESFGFQPILAIELLVERSLITISKGLLCMHDLIQDMGRNIVRQESLEEPGDRSRLWHYEDIKHVLMNETGSEKVEGIVMEYPKLGSRYPKDMGFLEELKLSSKAFAKLRNLRILIICCFHLFDDLEYLSNNLRYLDWRGYPSKSMPSEFRPMNLIELHVTNSNIEQLWTGTEVLYNLRVMDLNYSEKLTMSPDFENVPNLESLHLEGCTSLASLHPSFGSLRKLTRVELSGCQNLEHIPNGPHLESLKTIYAYGCLKLNNLGGFEHLKCLRRLAIVASNISQLSFPIGHITNLKRLDLGRCKNLTSVPNNIGQFKALKSLLLSNCSKLKELPEEVGDLVSLEELKADYTGIRELPSSICGLKFLEVLDLKGIDIESLPSNMKQLRLLDAIYVSDCKRLQELPELSPDISTVEAHRCESLRAIASPSIYKDIENFCFLNCFKLAENQESNILTDEFISNLFQGSISREIYKFKIIFPGSDIPKWFNDQSEGCSVCSKFKSTRIVGIAFAFVAIGAEDVFKNVSFNMRGKIVVMSSWTWKNKRPSIQSENVGVIYVTPRNDLLDLMVENLNKGEEFKVECEFKEIQLKKCGVRLVYKEEEEELVHGSNKQALSIYNSSSF